jgi:hypothetical protein
LSDLAAEDAPQILEDDVVEDVVTPSTWRQQLSTRLARSQVAVSLDAQEARLQVAQSNGVLHSVHRSRVALPLGALRPGLRAPNIAELEPVEAALESLVVEAREVGALTRSPKLVALLLPDAAFRMAVVPIQGEVPGRAEGEAMARWALRDLLPVDADEARVAWTVSAPSEEAPGWLVATGVEADLVREYEALVEAHGWTVGRVMGWSVALMQGAEMVLNGDSEISPKLADGWQEAIAGPGARLVLTSAGDSLTCLVEAEGVPRFYRAWRGRVPAAQVIDELPPVERYVKDRLELSVQQVLLCGSQQWTSEVSGQCEVLGWEVLTLSRWTALMGALGS